MLGGDVANVTVWPTKSMLSNTGAACGAVDIIAAVCAMDAGVIPPAKNCENKANGCGLNVPTETVQKPIRHVLSCSYTYGGQTAAVVLRKYADETGN